MLTVRTEYDLKKLLKAFKKVSLSISLARSYTARLWQEDEWLMVVRHHRNLPATVLSLMMRRPAKSSNSRVINV